MTKILLTSGLLVALYLSVLNGTCQKVRYTAMKTNVAPVLDGIASDECWADGTWGVLNKQWFSNRPMPDSSDFYARYKVVWTPEMIYVLMEITDDVFNDDIADPLKNYWEEDCIEIFIDEDKSGGDHKCCSQAYNAFAYHISPLTLDAVDLSNDGDFVPKLFNNNVDIAVHSVGKLHTAEIAIRIFDDTFNEDNANTPLTLTPNKLMGFTMAYCEDDGKGREDFLATQPGGLDSWMNANLLGELLLSGTTVSVTTNPEKQLQVYPNPAHDKLYVSYPSFDLQSYELLNITGKTLLKGEFEKTGKEHVLNLSDIPSGLYILNLKSNKNMVSKKVVVY